MRCCVNRFVAIVMTGAVSGCATSGAPAIEPERARIALEARSLTSPGLRHYVETSRLAVPGSFPPATWDPTAGASGLRDALDPRKRQ